MRNKLLKSFLAIVCLVISFGVTEAYVFNFDLKKGDNSLDVLELQKFLNQDPATAVAEFGPGSAGNETMLFGSLTYNAVVRFQEKYASEVLLPNGLFAGTGYVGPSTRQKINQISGLGVVAPTQVATITPAVINVPSNPANTSLPPKIVSITPQYITQNQQDIFILGENFDLTNKVELSLEPYPYSLVPLVNGGLTVKTKLEVFNYVKMSVSALKNTGISREEMTKAVIGNFDEGVEIDGKTYLPLSVVVKNSYGASSPFIIYIDVYSLLYN